MCEAERGAVERLAGVLTAEVPADAPRTAGLFVVEEEKVLDRGFGVMLLSAEGRRVFRCGAGVLSSELLGLESDVEASDMGGDGGS